MQLNEVELEIACYLVGKNYTAIEIFEISDYGEMDRFPYFRVTADGITYGSEEMGRGELSLLLTYWVLHDLPRESILILEEPETHVSPRSQDSLMNIVAKLADERAIWVLVTTHSPTVIRHIPRTHLKVLVRDQGRTKVVENATIVQIGELLGGGVAYQGLILVEDVTAQDFLSLFSKKSTQKCSDSSKLCVPGAKVIFLRF